MNSEDIVRLYQAYVDLESLNKALIRTSAESEQQQLKLLDQLEQSEVKRRYSEEAISRAEAEMARLRRKLEDAEEANEKLSNDMRAAEAQIAYLQSENESLNVENVGLRKKFSFARRFIAEADESEVESDTSFLTRGEILPITSTRLDSEDFLIHATNSHTVEPEPQVVEESGHHPPPVNVRKHSFLPFSPTMHSCDFCGDLITIGKKALRCADCHMRVHGKCNVNVRIPCTPRIQNVRIVDKHSLILEDFCPPSAVTLKIPFPVVQCITALESRGLHFWQLYRNPANDTAVKKLLDEFLSSRPFPNLDLQNATTISQCLKWFLSRLKDPIIPLHKLCYFTRSSGAESLKTAVRNLPNANQHTLAYLCYHFLNVLGDSRIEDVAHCLAPSIVAQRNESTTESINVLCPLLRLEKNFWSSILAVP